MTSNIEIMESSLIARPECEIDHLTAERLRAQIDSAFEKSSCRNIIFDFSNVSFMDSSGIGMIIGRYKSAEKRGGRLAITGMSDAMTRLYTISGLAKIIIRTDTVEEAIAKISEKVSFGREI